VLLDVREPWEFQICHLPGSCCSCRCTPFPPGLRTRSEADTVSDLHRLARSMQAAIFLERAGFPRLHNLTGGVDAWARTVEASMPVY
jgi:rhodanese-related sulfurtransferase